MIMEVYMVIIGGKKGDFHYYNSWFFKLGILVKKTKFGWGAKRIPCHFGQVDFNMSSVIQMVFFISKTRTI